MRDYISELSALTIAWGIKDKEDLELKVKKASDMVCILKDWVHDPLTERKPTEEIWKKVIDIYTYFYTLNELWDLDILEYADKDEDYLLRKVYLLFKATKTFERFNEFDKCKEFLSHLFKKCLDANLFYCCYIMVNHYGVIIKSNDAYDYHNYVKKIEHLLLCDKQWNLNKGFSYYDDLERTILFYYLGGIPNAAYQFLLYYRSVSRKYINYQFTPRQLYYLSLTSKFVEDNFDEISNFSILNIKEEDNISLYYKGQIYYLQYNIDSALECFEKSKDFLFSQIMYDYIKYGKQELKQPEVITINPEKDDYNVFHDYYFYHECYVAFKGYDNGSRIFNYFIGDKDLIIENVKDIEADRMAEQMYIDLKNRSVSMSKEEYERRIKMLDDLLLTKDGMVRRAIQETDEGIKRIPEKAEVQIALTIENFEIENIDFYALIIYNYYFRGIIDQQAVINLSFYVIAVAKNKLKSQIFDKLFDIGMSVTAVMLLCPFDIITHFKNLCLSTPLVAFVGSNLKQDFSISALSRYEIFKKELKHQELELKNQIGEELFNNQCKFVTIVNKVYQLDEYLLNQNR